MGLQILGYFTQLDQLFLAVRTAQIYFLRDALVMNSQAINHLLISSISFYIILARFCNILSLEFTLFEKNINNRLARVLILPYKPMKPKSIIILVLIITFAQIGGSIYVNVKEEKASRCFRAEQSPDKTLLVKLGLIRREPHACQVRFMVTFNDGAGNAVEKIHNSIQRCQEGRFRESEAVKHTPTKQLSQHVTGYYEICYQVIQNMNKDLAFQIFIGELLNPIMYEHSDIPFPLIGANQLMGLDQTVQSIKKGLVQTQRNIKEVTRRGEQIKVNLDNISSFNKLAISIQIGFLILFGASWLYLINKFGKKNSS